jgi:hypothetical protein
MTAAEIAAYFREKARWRQNVADDRCYPGTGGQHKNEMYANHLEEAAKYVESLPADDPLLVAAASIDENLIDGLHTHTIHCQTAGDYAGWVQGWIESAAEEVERQKTLHTFDGYLAAVSECVDRKRLQFDHKVLEERLEGINWETEDEIPISDSNIEIVAEMFLEEHPETDRDELLVDEKGE